MPVKIEKANIQLEKMKPSWKDYVKEKREERKRKRNDKKTKK